VSPRWYATTPAVPTWNYVAVHAYGPARAVDGVEAHARILRTLSRRYETGAATPWEFDALPERYTHGMIRGIVGFEIEVTRLDGKAKLSQNRSDEDRLGAIAGLQAAGDPDSRAVAALMAAAEPALPK
jgi:transcriptional regulator